MEEIGDLSSEEYARWLAFASVEPIGERREDLRAAQVCATVLSLFREKGKDPLNPAELAFDFWGDRRKPRRDQTPEEMRLALMTYSGTDGARFG